MEIGCGDGGRLAWLQANLNIQCSGIDPSAQAVEAAQKMRIDARQGTADKLPFEDSYFDLVCFGFCLYLCDRDDLFRIAAEADRVLKDSGWLIIFDFYSAFPQESPYKYISGLSTYKMDYKTLFTWHPSYTCVTHTVRRMHDYGHTDIKDEWVAVSTLRKDLVR